MAKTKKNLDVERAIQLIEKRYAIGKEILKQCGPVSPHGLIGKLAEQYGISRNTCQKLRAMAGRETGYSKSELNRWFREFRKAEFALTITHFIKLISVPRGPERDRLTKLAIEHAWSTHRLQAAILVLQGRRQVGGRKPKVVTGDQFEGELKRVLWSWDRWLTLHLEANEDLKPKLSRDMTALQRKILAVMPSLESE